MAIVGEVLGAAKADFDTVTTAKLNGRSFGTK